MCWVRVLIGAIELSREKSLSEALTNKHKLFEFLVAVFHVIYVIKSVPKKKWEGMIRPQNFF